MGHDVFPDLSLVWTGEIFKLAKLEPVCNHMQAQSGGTTLKIPIFGCHTEQNKQHVLSTDAHSGSISPLPTSGNWDPLGNINQVFKWNLKDMPSVSFD